MKKCKYAVNIIIDEPHIGGKRGTATGCALHGASENQLVKPLELSAIVCNPKCKDRKEIDC